MTRPTPTAQYDHKAAQELVPYDSHSNPTSVEIRLDDAKDPSAINETISHYKLIKKLGAGGMGEVFLAEDTTLHRKVAIKFLSAESAADERAKKRLIREAQAAATLDHPNICSIYEVSEEAGRSFIVMQYVEGETLATRIRNKPLDLSECLEIAVQVADALTEAHSHGIIHRDIKPQNIMLTASHQAKVMDFGLAEVVHDRSVDSEAVTESLLTEPGAIVGTLPYMSPEQVRGESLDRRSDIFSFGAVLYEIVTGRKAFTGKSQACLIAAILERDSEPMSAIQPLTPAALNRLVKKCLAKEPDERWQSAADLADELRWVAETGSGASTAAPVGARGRNRQWAWMAATAILLIGLVAALLFIIANFRRTPSEVSIRRFVIPPAEKQTFTNLSISPDGRTLVYCARTEGSQQLWVRQMDSLRAQPLPGTENTCFSFWSPDGQNIGFFADKKLKKMAISGGPAQTLADAFYPFGASWNREGVILFTPQGMRPLYRVSASGGEATQLTTLDESRHEIGHRWPFFLPDGRHFLYLARSSQTENSAICAGSLDSKETKRLISADCNVAYAPPGYLLFVREGTLMAQPFDADKLEVTGEAFPLVEHIRYEPQPGQPSFSVSSDGVLVYLTGNPTNQLTWFDRSGRPLGTVGPPAAYGSLRLSPDEKRVAVERNNPPSTYNDIWLMELGRGVPSRFTSDDGNEGSPVWSPDGSRIAFASNREGPNNLYQKLSSGAGGDEELLKSAERKGKFTEDWSADGRFILYRAPGGKSKFFNLWVLPLVGDRKPYLLVNTEFMEVWARFSSDGKWVAYVSDETGTNEVYVREFQGSSGKRRVSTGGGTRPRWRRDGKELFYIFGGKMMAVDVKADGSGFEPGVPKLLFERGGAGDYDVSGDGQRFLILVPVEERSPEPISVWLNWTAGLKR